MHRCRNIHVHLHTHTHKKNPNLHAILFHWLISHGFFYKSLYRHKSFYPCVVVQNGNPSTWDWSRRIAMSLGIVWSIKGTPTPEKEVGRQRKRSAFDSTIHLIVLKQAFPWGSWVIWKWLKACVILLPITLSHYRDWTGFLNKVESLSSLSQSQRPPHSISEHSLAEWTKKKHFFTTTC